jgi:hypothetical protein
MSHWDMFDAFMDRNSIKKEDGNTNDGSDPRNHTMESNSSKHSAA